MLYFAVLSCLTFFTAASKKKVWKAWQCLAAMVEQSAPPLAPGVGSPGQDYAVCRETYNILTDKAVLQDQCLSYEIFKKCQILPVCGKEATIWVFVPVLHAAVPSADASVPCSEKQEVGHAVSCLLTMIMWCDFKWKTFVSFHDEWWVRISIAHFWISVVSLSQISLPIHSTGVKHRPDNVMTVLVD